MFRDSVLAGPVLRRGVTALAVAAAATMFVGTAATAEPAAVVGEVSADSIAAARAQAIGTTVTVVGTATTPSRAAIRAFTSAIRTTPGLLSAIRFRSPESSRIRKACSSSARLPSR
jgi:hypothetical protein